ncbi:MAG: hypothetical protein FVQ77_05860 [Cytophagales bacterium]|nr:hypothetical protein [Cytophagales bacterium]
MKRLVFEIDKQKDLSLLLDLAEKLGLKKTFIRDETEINETKNGKKLAKYFRIIDKGADVSSYGNPSNWQRDVRKDRKLNFP